LGDELWVVNQVVYSSRGGAERTMLKDILAAIDNEIAYLERAKALLSASGIVVARRKPGRAAKVAIAVTPKGQKTRKRHKMSAEARERIRQAQIKRWAALKETPKAKKKAAKAA
jgi:DNA-binding MarR family transcriptional regulator